MADGKLIELLFEPEIDLQNSALVPRYKVAFQSLVSKPQQLFFLLLDKEKSSTFFTGFGSYGKHFAKLLEKFSEYLKPTSEHHLHFKKDDIRMVFEEALMVFLFSLIASDYPDTESQESMADISMAVIKLSKPGQSLKLLGVRLGEVPLILSRLIADGRIGSWSQNQPESFKSIISDNTALVTWARTIAGLAEHCVSHYAVSQDVGEWEKMQEIVQSFPCNTCQVISSKGTTTESTVPRWKDSNRHKLGSNIKTFDSLLGDHLGPWKIILSTQALKDLKEAAHSGYFGPIREKLVALASGDWVRSSLRKPIKYEGRYRVPVYQATCEGNVVIIWQVDIAFDERHDCDFQVIKVWAICAYREVENVCGCISQAQEVYSNSRVAACQTKDLERAKCTIFPKYVQLDESPNCKSDKESASAIHEEKQSAVADRRMIEGSPLLGKFYSLTTVVLDNVHPEALSAVFPVDISGEEVHVINHFRTPAFILGRSGTGKTTCLIYKLASRYLSSKITDETPVRQLLLTRSKNLAQKLKLYTKRLIDTRMGVTDVDPQNEETDADWDDSEEDTTQTLLSLKDQDFPLVCTFNYFLRLLENLVEVRYQKRRVGKVPKPVNFVTFSTDYWERFPRLLSQRIPVDLAFIDIMGVIKGSASAESGLEPLSRDAYINKRWKLAPTFATDSERNAVYTLYEHYEKIKSMRGEVDNTDRVIRVLKSLNKEPELQRMLEGFLDEVYVDEVQDQRPIEIEVLLTLIRNPWGVHFAGDTAQSISKDSLFRFANAKALFYTRFSKLLPAHSSKSYLVPALLPLSHNFRSHKGILTLASFVMELLYTGFPDLVDELPPEIGENLGPKPILYIGSGLLGILQETEKTAGEGVEEKPLGAETPAGGEKDAEVTEFGEERVILVRDEQTQKELEDKIGDFALVLTILQSKGMEFEDVFLYNFFTTSSYSSNLTILEDLLRRRNYSDRGTMGEPTWVDWARTSDPTIREDLLRGRNYSAGETTGEPMATRADWAKTHIALCSELKHLYVGVTRARTRLWIVESEENVIPPIKNLFNKAAPKLFPMKYPEELVEIVRESNFETSDLRKRFHSTNQTSPARWRELAYELMTNKAYAQASTCFKKAKDKCGEALADAYLAELKGMEYRAKGFKKESALEFDKASESFRKAGRTAKAVECQEAIGNIVAAAEIWSQNGAHEEAAFLFAKAKEPKKAAREYHELGKHEKALATYFHAGLYNEMAVYLKDFSTKINASCRKQNSRLCYVLLIHEKIALKLYNTLISSIGSEVEQENTFQEFRMINHVFDLYVRQKRNKEAYEIAVKIGFLEEALRLGNENRLVTQSHLTEVFYYIQSRNLLAKKPLSGNSSSRMTHKNIAAGLRNTAGNLVDQVWKELVTVLNIYLNSGRKPDRTRFQDDPMRGLCDLLVTMKTPKVVSLAPGLSELPLEFVQGAIGILRAITLEKMLPFPARLLFGIYQVPNQHGEYIALPWSSLCADKALKFPMQYLDSKVARDEGCRQIFGIVIATLDFLDQNSQWRWTQALKSRGNRGLVAGQFSRDLRALLDLNLLFLNVESIHRPISYLVGNHEPVLAKWRFWMSALIEQLSFVSSYEQDAAVLVKAKHELRSTTPEFQMLYNRLQEFFLSEAESRVPRNEYLSSKLRLIQLARFLDVEERCFTIINGRRPRNGLDLELSFKIIGLAQDVRNSTRLAHFPGYFCEKVHSLLLGLKSVQIQTAQLSFYSPSVISLYEELITLLILLVRPIHFVIPRSFASLHLPKWAKIHRSTSEREYFFYLSLLVKVVISFCELVSFIESRASSKLVKADTLALRSLHLVVISMINIGALDRRPLEYIKLWNKAQRVFNSNGLRAMVFRGVLPDRLLEKLVKAFDFYAGKDKLGVVVTDGYERPTGFAGLSLAKHGIAVAYEGIPKPQTRRRALLNPRLEVQRINAAYLITRFWQTNRKKFITQMRCERALLAERQKSKICQNCCIMAEMRHGKDIMY